QGLGQLGFRVPALVVGPYVKPGYVSSTIRDHTSVLRHIENRFQIPPLGMRDTAAADLSDCIDVDRQGRQLDPAEPFIDDLPMPEAPSVDLSLCYANNFPFAGRDDLLEFFATTPNNRDRVDEAAGDVAA